MASGLKKLSEFKGQEHITAPLRSMVMKKDPVRYISIVGDAQLAHDIFAAFAVSLNCEETVRGDACDNCSTHPKWLSTWYLHHLYQDGAVIVDYDAPNIVYAAYTHREGFLEFQIKEAAGEYIDERLLVIFILAFQAQREELIKSTTTLIREGILYTDFITGLIQILKNVLYIKQNFEVRETNKLEALNTLAARISTPVIFKCLKLLWDAQAKNVLPEDVKIEMLALLLADIFQPLDSAFSYETSADGTKTPINVVEDNLEQPLDLDDMLRIARE